MRAGDRSGVFLAAALTKRQVIFDEPPRLGWLNGPWRERCSLRVLDGNERQDGRPSFSASVRAARTVFPLPSHWRLAASCAAAADPAGRIARERRRVLMGRIAPPGTRIR